MNIERIEKNSVICAVVRSEEIVITDSQSALDLLMTAKYEAGTENIIPSNSTMRGSPNHSQGKVSFFAPYRLPKLIAYGPFWPLVSCIMLKHFCLMSSRDLPMPRILDA